MCINVPWYFQIILPDDYPRYNILINGYGYKNVVEIGGNENNPEFSKRRGKLPYLIKKGIT